MDCLKEYIQYHLASSRARDIDTANDCLKYICDRYELNIEQRYWMAFLYASTYSSATAFYMYNEFPDFENVDVDRMRRWWEQNKSKTIFQTDRRWTKSNNQFVDSFVSYREFIGGVTQQLRYACMNTGNPSSTYDVCMSECSSILTFGRFTLFLYLEAIHHLTGFKIHPDSLDLNNAESSRNGLCFAIGEEGLMTHFTNSKLSKVQIKYLSGRLKEIVKLVEDTGCEHKTIWSIETTLCAFKKHKLGKRYIGYYIDRQADEIRKMQKLVTDGVDWDVLWQFRKETYGYEYTKNDFANR